ncbi:CHAT domain-containing protein [Sphaerothrix gracilis]|uniref:CHAT domain-containing protein n=1 Tax=Sphaerothrix gracilis TaxID=3151835 RepID=UPI0031FD89BB
MTQEFHISITSVGAERYLIRTEQVAPGTPLAEEQVVWPLADWLQQTQQLMHEPLRSLLAGHPPFRVAAHSEEAEEAAAAAAVSANAPGLVMLGQQLYSALFQGMIRDSWLTAQGIAQHSQQVLRLRLGIKDPKLQKLPWEVLHDGDRPLATGTDLTFCRYHSAFATSPGAMSAATTASETPLRALMVVSAPDDQEKLALKREVQQLQAELQPPAVPDPSKPADDFQPLQVEVTLLEQPGRTELVQALEQGKFQILHYAGHSNLGKTGGDLYLVSQQTGLSEQLSGEDLAGLLVNNGVRLAVFNSCRGAYSEADTHGGQEQNLAQALINRGVPGVIAMAERIPDEVAITFTRLLYRNLRQGYSIDLSLNRTRQGLISAYGSHQFYWALPVLYMHPRFNGALTSQLANPVMALDNLLFPASAQANRPDASPPADTDNLVAALEADDDYDEDFAVVADLLQQLSPQDPEQSQSATAVSGAPAVSTSEAAALSDDSPETPIPAEKESVATAVLANGQTASSPAVAQPSRFSLKALSWQRQPKLWLPLVGAAALIIAVGSASVLQNGLGNSSLTAEQILENPALLNELDELDETIDPVAIATVAFNQDQLSLALKMVERLLDENRFSAAAEVIQAASEKQKNSSEYLYLLGRLQWQGLAAGIPEYSANDAARSWDAAVEQRPSEIEYWVALGFARYGQNQYQEAIAAWEEAVALDLQQQNIAPFIGTDNDALVANPVTLSAYAGLSLAMRQLANLQPNLEQRQRALNTAKKHYLFVIQAAPNDFNSDRSLSRNWLWQEAAIADWFALQTEIFE